MPTRRLPSLLSWLCAALLLVAWGCLPDDPVDDNNPFTDDDDTSEAGDDDDDTFVPSDPEDCPIWAPEYKIGFFREFYMEDDTDRNASFTGLSEWQGGVYWTDEVVVAETGDLDYRIYDHCIDDNLYRVGLEQADGSLLLFNPPVLQLEADAAEGSVWQSEYNYAFRHITERYEVLGMESIDVQAGTFDAMHVSMRLSYTENDEQVIVWWDSYYAEGLGLVKQESTTPTYVELVSYEMPEEWR
jgi:hypothetical protein